MPRTNEYGAELDSNGYAPSILDNGSGCFICGSQQAIQRHEIYNNEDRPKCKNLGIWVHLCEQCHTRITHKEAQERYALKVECEPKVLEYYGWTVQDFRQRFRKNYIDE